MILHIHQNEVDCLREMSKNEANQKEKTCFPLIINNWIEKNVQRKNTFALNFKRYRITGYNKITFTIFMTSMFCFVFF